MTVAAAPVLDNRASAAQHKAAFPIFDDRARARPLVYLDNGATTQKPRVVLDALRHFYEEKNANIHRGVYELSQQATDAYESARRTVQHFINARESAEVIFTRGTTEGINLVAHSFGQALVRAGDEIVISALEHHSNIVPWQMLCQRSGARLRVLPMNDAGELVEAEIDRLITSKTKLVAVTHLSNSLGTLPPVERIIRRAREVGARVLIDGAQWVAHAATDVQELDCDFYVFSGHKLFGPTGIGVLYGRREVLDVMPPFLGGGDMIASVSFAKTTYAELPAKFEAGTPPIAQAVGLAAAIDFVQSVGLDSIAEHERELYAYLTEQLQTVPGLRLIGQAGRRASVASFVLEDPAVDQHTLGIALDMEGVAVRTGHHCCQPVMDQFEIPGTTRASIALYNTPYDVDALTAGLKKIVAGMLAKPATRRAMAKVGGKTVEEPSESAAAKRSPGSMAGQPAEAGVASRAAGDSFAAIAFPPPAADSPGEAARQLAEDFELLGDWPARDEYLVELGEQLPIMPAPLKTEQTRVHGCMSVVHLFGRPAADDPARLNFLADSDAPLVRGLVAVLQQLFAGQRAREILAFDTDAFLSQIGLDRHLSMGRRSGLAGMIQRIHAHANQIVATKTE